MIQHRVKCSCGKTITFSFKEKPQAFIYTWKCKCAMTAWYSPYYAVEIETGTSVPAHEIVNRSISSEQPKVDVDGTVVYDPDRKEVTEGTRFSLLEVD